MRYAIADIHGGNNTFQVLLRKINFRHSDQLFLLGDYVDRGPDSKGVLNTILELKNSGYDVKAVRGNHDEMLLRTIINDHDEFSELYYDEWGRHTLQSFETVKPGLFSSKYDLFETKAFSSFPQQHLALLESMPYIIVESDFVFVHAGLDMSTDDPINESDMISMLWSRSISNDVTKLGGKQLVTGHTVVTLDDIIESIDSGHICLDNGAFTEMQPEMGNLVALNLDTNELTIQPWCDSSAEY